MAEDQQQQQHAQNSEQHDSQQSLDPQPNGQQFSSGEQAPESADQVKESIQKAVSKNLGGKRERATKRLNDAQKAQRRNPRVYNPLRQKREN
jgi:hypothetical protein